jgi:hypothetical protein
MAKIIGVLGGSRIFIVRSKSTRYEEQMARTNEGAKDITIRLMAYCNLSKLKHSYWPFYTFYIFQCANTLLSTFEANSSSKTEIKQSKIRREKEIENAINSSSSLNKFDNISNGSTRDPRSHYMGCKYLTSSQLFALELQDPSIRQQLAIQLLVIDQSHMTTFSFSPLYR